VTLAARRRAPPAGLDWTRLGEELDVHGCAVVPGLLSPTECRRLAAGFETDTLFRNRVVMSRHGYGQGEYRYFRYPLPALVARLRAAFFPPLAAIANRWNEQLGREERFPDQHAAFLERCHRDGQLRPTPLLLQYGPGDYNCLHQDLYGQHVFPVQLAVLLNAPGDDFTGGEFVLTEQRPRKQSRVEVVPLARGDGVLFPVNERPVRGGRGFHRVKMRHGVSRIRSGARHTLGVIFHDAL
jgi:hypothetical protein